MRIQANIGIAIAVFAFAQAAAAGEVSAPAVERALREALVQMKVEAALMPGSLKIPIAPHGEDAQVEAERVTVDRDGHVDARLRCRPASACLPFHASADVRYNGAARVQTWTARQQSRVAAKGAKKLKRGERVVFLRERDGMRIRVIGVALNAAAAGEDVGVRAVDGTREVLHGSLGEDGVVRGES